MSDGESNPKSESKSNESQGQQPINKVMALIGNIDVFVPGSDFESYEDRMEQYFVANDVVEEKKTSTFISIAGEAMYDILKKLTLPVKPSELSYNELLKKLRNHFKPLNNKRAERYKFNKAVQEQGETISEFIIRLKSLSQTCLFGDFLDNENGESVGNYKLKILDESLTDRFIVGLVNEKIKSHLLGDDKLTFEECCAKALRMEMIQIESKSLQPMSIKAIKKNSFPKSQSKSNFQNNNFDNSKRFNRDNKSSQCRRCGRYHNEQTCPAQKWKCYTCNKFGHISTMCFKANANIGGENKSHHVQHQAVKNMEYDYEYEERDSGNFINTIRREVRCKENSEDELTVSLEPEEEQWVKNELQSEQRKFNVLKRCNSNALDFEVEIEGKKVNMECDTGAVVTVMSVVEFEEKFSHLLLNSPNCNIPLQSVSGEKLSEVGTVKVSVEFLGKKEVVLLSVLDTSRAFTALFGRNWLDVFVPNWKKSLSTPIENINAVSQENLKIKEIESKFPRIVSKNMDDPIEGFKADLVLKENAQPIFHCAYTVPFKLKEAVSKEIDRLVALNILIPIKHSQWASPLVVRVKSNGELRLCIDGKVTINRYLETDHHPLHRIDDIFASLSNCYVFCVIDLKGAFKQVELTSSSQQYVVINTHKGLYKCTRMFDGLKVAPAIFQSIMDQLLVDLEKVKSFIDDIIVGGTSIDECKSRLFEVFARLEKYNVRVNLEKCKFFRSKVKYLGHVLEHNKLYPNPEKVKAIVDAPAPKDLSQLQAYLGLLNYYGEFIPNLSSEIHDLYELLRADKEFVWTKNCQRSFDRSKVLLTSNQVLELYDPEKEIIVAADASPYGVGAALSHLVSGVEKPVLFASSTLSPAEKNYSQPQREALAIIFALKKFYKYIYGKKFTIVTDAQCLRDLFNPKKGISPVAAARLQRWAIYLSMYDYEIRHKSGSKMGNVDALSRLPLEGSTDVEVEKINFINFGVDIPIELKDIDESTQNDPILSQVYKYVLNGWPPKVSPEINSYFLKRNSLSTESNCLYYIDRVIIPEKYRLTLLNTLHECHTGIVRMKMSARQYVWWPLIDKDIEKFVSECLTCQQTQPVKKPLTTSKWKMTLYPFERVHIDFAKHSGKEVLIISDAFSKYCDVKLMSCTQLFKVEEKLTEFFSIFGLPSELVSDNGPPFQSTGFDKFCQRYKIKLTHSPPWHPPSNGQAERSVRTVKQCLYKFLLGVESGLPIQQKIQKFIMYHNNSPSTVTGKSPSELIFGYKPKTLLDLVNLKYKEKVDNTNINEVTVRNENNSKFKVDQNVMYRNHFKNYVHWIPATVLQVVSKFTYLIRVYDNVRFVHEDQLKFSKLSDSHHKPKNIVLTKEVIVKENKNSKSRLEVKDNNCRSNSVPEKRVKKRVFLENKNSQIPASLNYKTKSGRTIVKPDYYRA